MSFFPAANLLQCHDWQRTRIWSSQSAVDDSKTRQRTLSLAHKYFKKQTTVILWGQLDFIFGEKMFKSCNFMAPQTYDDVSDIVLTNLLAWVSFMSIFYILKSQSIFVISGVVDGNICRMKLLIRQNNPLLLLWLPADKGHCLFPWVIDSGLNILTITQLASASSACVYLCVRACLHMHL